MLRVYRFVPPNTWIDATVLVCGDDGVRGVSVAHDGDDEPTEESVTLDAFLVPAFAPVFDVPYRFDYGHRAL